MAAALRPDGLLLLDQLNREAVLRDFHPELHFEGKTTITRWEQQRLVSTWYIGEETERAGTSAIRVYTPAQVRRLFAQAGHTWETAYVGMDSSPYRRRKSGRLVAVERKEGDRTMMQDHASTAMK